MSKLSIYENNWIDLVFENKNKEYGAYQLRHDSFKTSINALFMGILVASGVVTSIVLVNKIKAPAIDASIPTVLDETIHVTPLELQRIEEQNPLPEAAPAQSPVQNDLVDQSQLINPVVTTSEIATPDIVKNVDYVTPIEPAPNGTGVGTSNSISGGTGGTGTAPTGSSETSNAIENTSALDVLPEFPGGIAKFYKYISNNYRHPDLDTDQTFRVFVSFVIEKDGTLTDIKVINDPGYGLGKEAIRVLKALKVKWSPGMINSKPVRTAYNLPIVIKTE